ncbi:hypothetical protein JW879_09920 [candidate division WOR-3 bacterium]|nr:hypothetical protein [candidate division WOR-3 bacterium]
MIDLQDLKDNFNLEAVFNLGPPKEYVGKLDSGMEVLDRIDLVLTQTFDAIGSLPFRQLVVKGGDKKVIIFYYRNNFVGVVANKDENVESILKYIYEKESAVRAKARVKEKKPERVVVEKKEKIEAEKVKKEEIFAEEKEAEKEEIKAKEAETRALKAEKKEEVEEIKEVSVPKVILDARVIDDIEEIAGNYLGDFSLDIVSNVIEDSGVNREKPTKDQVLEVAQSLKDAAALIVGPSKAKKLKEEIMKKIEEER